MTTTEQERVDQLILQALIDQQRRQQDKDELLAFLTRDGYEIPCGLGTEDSPCSLAAINLVLDDEFTDNIRPDMSDCVGRWIRDMQDAMPHQLRNALSWRMLLPEAAWTGNDNEDQVQKYQQQWLFESVLASVNEIATYAGIIDPWKDMIKTQHKQAIEDVFRAILVLDKENWGARDSKGTLRGYLRKMLSVTQQMIVNPLSNDLKAEIYLWHRPGTERLDDILNNAWYAWDYYTGIMGDRTEMSPGKAASDRMLLQEWLYDKKFDTTMTLYRMIKVAEGK